MLSAPAAIEVGQPPPGGSPSRCAKSGATATTRTVAATSQPLPHRTTVPVGESVDHAEPKPPAASAESAEQHESHVTVSRVRGRSTVRPTQTKPRIRYGRGAWLLPT